MGVYATMRGGYQRRVVSVHSLQPRGGSSVRLVPLVAHDERSDEHGHDEEAELAALCRCGPDKDANAAQLERLTDFLEGLSERELRDIPAVRAALAEYRGESVPLEMRGDPT